MDLIHFADPELAAAIEGEKERQNLTIELIASENFVPEVILEAQGSLLTNKYAEGYPGKRYHGGCQFIDVVESLAIERAKKLFGLSMPTYSPIRASTQTSQYSWQCLIPAIKSWHEPKPRRHLSHGASVSISGKFSSPQLRRQIKKVG